MNKDVFSNHKKQTDYIRRDAFEKYVVAFARLFSERVDGVFNDGLEVEMHNTECHFLTALGALLTMYIDQKSMDKSDRA